MDTFYGNVNAIVEILLKFKVVICQEGGQFPVGVQQFPKTCLKEDLGCCWQKGHWMKGITDMWYGSVIVIVEKLLM